MSVLCMDKPEQSRQDEKRDPHLQKAGVRLAYLSAGPVLAAQILSDSKAHGGSPQPTLTYYRSIPMDKLQFTATFMVTTQTFVESCCKLVWQNHLDFNTFPKTAVVFNSVLPEILFVGPINHCIGMVDAQ